MSVQRQCVTGAATIPASYKYVAHFLLTTISPILLQSYCFALFTFQKIDNSCKVVMDPFPLLDLGMGLESVVVVCGLDCI